MATQDAYPVIQGPAATGAAVSGNPVLLGAQDSAGNVAPFVLGGVGAAALRTYLTTANGAAQVNVGTYGDGGSQSNGLAVGATLLDFNGATMDRHRNNTDVTLLASAARTTTQTSANITTYNLGAIKFVLDVTAIVSTCSLTVSISEIDPASGKAITLLTGAVVSTVSTNEYTVDPTVPAVANVSAQKRVPRTIMYTVTVGNANSQTYSLGAMESPA